ncbi:hypothetical protein GCM10011609_78210 [Lentzea pudingi]|uniref:Uncharacterized protein n=1 Tax=Lentzea pudingi TaxID=1789439 RepID=A0ABQ2IRX2_9PSEU|nr:hypothetical protein GCM10011609_78210 [Lentzea pudingi]
MVLLVWVVVFAAVADVANPRVLLASAVSGGLVCACAAVGGVVATRVTGEESAARLRHVFVVLEGAALVLFFPFCWFGFGVEPVGRPGTFAAGAVLVLAVPVVAALVIVVRRSFVVHELVPDTGGGAPVQRIRVLATVLVTVGLALSAGVVAVAAVATEHQVVLLVVGLLVTLMPVLLGVRLMDVADVHSARRRNAGNYVVVPAAAGIAVFDFSATTGPAGTLFGVMAFGAVVLLVIAILVLRDFTGEWDRPWRDAGKVSR